MLPSVRPLARPWTAGLHGSSRSGSRSRSRTRGYGVAAWLSRSRLADCCAMSSCRSPYASVAAADLRRHGRSPVRAALDQQGPDDAGRLVGQGDGDQHPRLAREHPRQPRARAAPRWLAQRTTALAPRMSSRRMVRSPIFEMAPSLCLPPVDFCSGVSPSQAAKSRPARKPSGAGTRAVIAVAAIGPMPGIVMSRRATGSALARRVISPSSSLRGVSKTWGRLVPDHGAGVTQRTVPLQAKASRCRPSRDGQAACPGF